MEERSESQKMFLKAETLYLLCRDKESEEYEKFKKLKATLFADWCCFCGSKTILLISFQNFSIWWTNEMQGLVF